MLIGEYKHNIDPKKRIALPAKFRREIGENAVISKGQEKCLYVYPLKEWQQVAENLSKLPTGQAQNRAFARLVLAEARDVEIDALGRILIPDNLKTYAQLADEAIIIGVYKRLEIWNPKNWEEYKAKLETEADSLAEKMGEMGAY
jgi:MraZ protein